MDAMLNIAVRAARQAGRIAVRSYERGGDLRVNEKSRNDFVSEVDRACEAAIIDELRGKFPNHAILAEESGGSKGRDGSDEFQWIIDPLDGTTNYLHGFPQWSISIGLRYRGLMEQAVVYDPLREELFTASRGGGAMLNDRRIRVSDRRGLEGALIGTGIPFRDQSHLTSYLSMLAAMVRDTAGIRRPGSAALDFAYVAAGRLDGFWELGLSPWDFAAGALLVAEAGGTVSDLAGGDRFFETCNLVAGSLKVHRAMIERLKPFRGGDLAA
ncbi:inositol monophosphatase family protein [Halochromatium salexigens]|uniref:Inositol-1-monophosphatase n=1 Tax=Halochromatium salexigens TaxID=49447 RepID=A0AAJ0UHU2_HALSE|nr:inositol monophosphatase family protein [Halochromatium salexigens]MBK5931085.1 inositol monophosphatase [Halochromatium salexigens]